MVRSERACKRERAWTRPVIPPGYILEILYVARCVCVWYASRNAHASSCEIL